MVDKKVKIRKFVKNPKLIECPFCGNAKEFDVSTEHDSMEDDEHIRTIYDCPNCGKSSTRCYEFYAWEDAEGNELEEE